MRPFNTISFKASNCVVNAYIQFIDVHQKWIEGGNYELCIEDVRDEIWDMVKPAPLRITLSDLLSCKQGGTVANSCDFIFRVSEVLHHVAFAKQSLNSLLEKRLKSSSRVMKGSL
nr:probable serine/threonine-protein phosphatase 2A regulatory subunit B'' subunit TON2 [Tanacetum cinerariifolium]